LNGRRTNSKIPDLPENWKPVSIYSNGVKINKLIMKFQQYIKKKKLTSLLDGKTIGKTGRNQ
jgi:hypothetical protein